jgi:hypothetical protein
MVSKHNTQVECSCWCQKGYMRDLYHLRPAMAMSMEQDPGNVLSRLSYLVHPLWYLGLSNGDKVDRSEWLTWNSQPFMNRLQYLLSWSHCVGYKDVLNFSCWNVGRTETLATGYQSLFPMSGVFSSPGSSVLRVFERHECQNTMN